MMFIRGSKPRPHKYGAVRTTNHAGMSFASKLESALYDHLAWLEKAGAIGAIKLQPHVFLTESRIEMIPDFRAYDTLEGADVYFEAKGFETDVWRIKRRLWMNYGPGVLRVFKGSARSIKMVEEIRPRVLPLEK